MMTNTILQVFAFRQGVLDGSHHFTKNRINIGRSPKSDLRFDSRAVSREHATLVIRHGILLLEDQASANGTYVNDLPIDRVSIDDNDEIRIGEFTLKFRILNQSKSDHPLYETSMEITEPEGIRLSRSY